MCIRDRCVGEPHAGPDLRELVDDQAAAHARQRRFARRVDVGDADGIRCRKGDGKLVREMERARIEVRLEEREDATPRRSDGAANCGEVRGELCWMVRVAVEHRDAARLTLALCLLY